jgi:aspartate/methionine/tyrosine aminotransferase
MNENNHGYSASIGTPAFREAVTKLYSSKFPITAADVQINHGVNMGLLAVLMAFTNEGDEVLVPEIGYPFYQDLCPAMKRKAVPYKLKKNCNFEIDLQHAASLINERTSFMYVINPTNPMGTVFTRTHM